MSNAPVGQDHVTVAPGPYSYQPLGDAQVTVTSTASTIAALLAAAAGSNGQPTAIHAGARLLTITVEASNVRYTGTTGQSPTTTFGTLLDSGQSQVYQGDLTAVQFIAVSGSPVLDLIFFK
jgi:hypothetical protein